MNSGLIIEKKIKNRLLTYNEIKYMVDAYINNSISEKTMTLFIKSIYNSGLSFNETLFLTDVMIKSGKVEDLSFVENVTVDKHSTGGVGDKTSLIVLPICASLGITVPKMSGRSLGATGGTVDKLESIPGFKSELSHKEFVNIINTVGCVDICQTKDIAVADKKIYSLRDKTGYVDSIPLIASSIMSKKIACSSKNIVIDLKVGKGAFMKNIKDATKLAKLMIKIGKYYNRKVICILTDMNIPLGNNVGNKLEVKEVINFFDGKYDKRLYELVLCLSSYMVSISKNISLSYSKKLVLKSLRDDSARNKFYEWIKSQGGNLKELKVEAKRIDVKSDKKGYIKSIDALIIGKISSELVGLKPKDLNTGIVLKKRIGDFVEKNEVIASIYYNKEVNSMISNLRDSFKFNDTKIKERNIILKIIK